MEDTNNRDNNIDIVDSNDGTIDESGNNEVEDREDEDKPPVWLNINILQRLKQNDSGVTNLNISLTGGYFNNVNWKEDGDCIADNTQLKKLRISFGMTSTKPNYWLGEEGVNLPTEQQLQGFFSCIHRNSSITALSFISLRIFDKFGGDLIEGLCGNQLEKLEIGQGRLGSMWCVVLGKVLNHPESKVKHLLLPNCQLDDETLGSLCDNALLGNSTLKKLCLRGNDEDITSTGYQALSAVIQHPKCKLVELDLNSTGMNDDDVNMLGSALRGSSLKSLILDCNPSISSRGWQTLLNNLTQTQIEKLDLSDANIDDSGLTALASISTLWYLDLYDNEFITSSGWRSFFTLKERSISNITPKGWVILNLGSNTIDDEGIRLFARLVSSMGSLLYMTLCCNRLITPTGWLALSDYLQSPSFSLETLDLDENNINDDTVIDFTRALENNKTLKSLYLYQNPDDDEYADDLITDRGWEAVSTLLCNKSTILNTYNSNHTLQDLGHHQNDMNLPSDLSSHLELNRNEDKVEVARQKILQTHFSGSEDDTASKMQELLDMELEMMSSVIAWIGRPLPIGWEGAQVSGLSTLYNLMRRLPDLFDSSPQKKSSAAKRKRSV